MPAKPPTYVIVDMDGTIADVRHRLHHIEGPGKKNWNAFFAGMGHDTPIEPMLQQVRNLSLKHQILIVTGRPEHYRPQTEAWLEKYNVPYEKLFMRESGDHRPDYVAKSSVLNEINPAHVVLAIDDRPPVCEMWERHGIKCQLVDSGEENREVNELYRREPGEPSGAKRPRRS